MSEISQLVEGDQTKDLKTTPEKISAIKKQVRAIREARQEQERQWLVNVAFLYGKHHFNISRKPSVSLEDEIVWHMKDIERGKKLLRSSNYILPLFRSLLSRMLMTKANITVEATTNSGNDKDAARVSQEVLEDFWQNANKRNPMLSQETGGMLQVLKKIFTYMLSCSYGTVLPYFNPNTRAKAFLNDRILDEVDIGEVEVKVFSPFAVYRPKSRRFVIVREFLPIEVINDLYNVKPKAEKLDSEDAENQVMRLLNNDYPEDEDCACVYTKYTVPDQQNPLGLMTVCTGKEIITEEGSPAEYKGRVPAIDLTYMDMGFSSYGQGMIEQLVSLQEEYNYTLSRLAGYKKWFAGKLLVPRGSKLSSKWNDELAQIIFFNQGYKPEYQQGGAPPTFLVEDLLRIRKDMEDIACVHDSSINRDTAQVKSGIAIENLNELDNSQIAPELMSVEQKLEYFAEMVVDIMKERYTDRRFLNIAGDQNRAEVNSFVGKDLEGNRRIKIMLGSTLPSNKGARQEFIINAQKMGWLSPDKAKELMEFGDTEGIWQNLDETAAKEENQKLGDPGYQIIAEPHEDHTTHIKVHQDFMKGSEYQKLPPELRQIVVAHVQQHQQMLSMEAQAAARVQPQGAPAGQPVG